MKINTTMPSVLIPYYENELKYYSISLSQGHFEIAWTHLERAHILGQRYPIAHTSVHWEMLKFGFRLKNYREIIGQLPRLIVGGVKSFVGKIPLGNPGGANVPPLKPFPIAEDLQKILNLI